MTQRRLTRLIKLFGFSTQLLFIGISANAATFETSFLKIQIPTGWACELQNGQYLCQDQKYKKQNYALLLISAKQAASEDNLVSYQEYLSKPIERVTQDFKSLKSKVIKSGKSIRNGIEWVESLHKDSEAKGYMTRYFATTHRGLAILISLSVHEKYTDIFNRLFANTWDTLEIKKYDPALAATIDKNAQILTEQDLSKINNLPETSQTTNFVSKNSSKLLLIAFTLIAAFFAFIFSRRNKN
jgi:hypothetical protein